MNITFSRNQDILIASVSGVLDPQSDQIADRAVAAECER